MKRIKVQGANMPDIHYDKSDIEDPKLEKDFDEAIEYLEDLEAEKVKDLLDAAKYKKHRDAEFEIGFRKTKFRVIYNGMRFELKLID